MPRKPNLDNPGQRRHIGNLFHRGQKASSRLPPGLLSQLFEGKLLETSVSVKVPRHLTVWRAVWTQRVGWGAVGIKLVVDLLSVICIDLENEGRGYGVMGTCRQCSGTRQVGR